MNTEKAIVEIENQLYTTLDPAERHRLLQRLIKDLDQFGKDAEFIAAMHCRIAEGNERIARQKELVARLKVSGQDTKDAYFLLITLKTTQALFDYHCTLARKIVVCIVPSKG